MGFRENSEDDRTRVLKLPLTGNVRRWLFYAIFKWDNRKTNWRRRVKSSESLLDRQKCTQMSERQVSIGPGLGADAHHGLLLFPSRHDFLSSRVKGRPRPGGSTIADTVGNRCFLFPLAYRIGTYQLYFLFQGLGDSFSYCSTSSDAGLLKRDSPPYSVPAVLNKFYNKWFTTFRNGKNTLEDAICHFSTGNITHML